MWGKIPLTGKKFRQMVGSAFIYLLSVDHVPSSIPRAGVYTDEKDKVPVFRTIHSSMEDR